ncbi:MAG: TrbG/VirB9 family P-type conjugative transfer protein [Pseudomonadota bacterium]
MRLLLVLLALVATVPAAAQTRPQPGPGDPRVQSVEYNAEQVVLLQAAPGYQISVEFAPDERIENVALGDSGAWQATPNKRGDHLFVKPIQGGVTTNMTVLTDSRLYAFELRPLFGAQSDMAYTVRFRYPGAAAAAPDGTETAAGTEPARGRYRLSGDRSIRPSGIDDDGAKTYIEWAAESALPAVYSVDAKGKEALVNGNMRDGIFVIDSVVPRLVFRLDKQIARAVRVSAREPD